MDATGTTRRTTTTPTTTSTTTTTDGTSSTMTSSSTHARAREDALLEVTLEGIRRDYANILGRAMPRYTEAQLRADLKAGTPSEYYDYALGETANAPYPSWRYTLAIVARLKKQHVPPEDLLFTF